MWVYPEDETPEWFGEERKSRPFGWVELMLHWWFSASRHRVNGPAVEQSDGHKEWYLDWKLHREDGPAIEGADGTLEWWQRGKRHPARIDAEEEGRASQQFGQDDGPGQGRGQADAGEEAFEAGNGEDGKLQIGVGDEHDAKGCTQDKGAVRGKAGIDHFRSPCLNDVPRILLLRSRK
jgi:hypothetical protein